MKNNCSALLFLWLFLFTGDVFFANNDSIQRVSLQNKNLFSLPPGIDFENLVSLNIRYNQLKFLPDKLATAKNLAEIDASHNKALNIESFNSQVKKLFIKKLSLDHCNLLYFPLEY